MASESGLLLVELLCEGGAGDGLGTDSSGLDEPRTRLPLRLAVEAVQFVELAKPVTGG